jgi:Polyketide cyclase / dehydrase and lipid transport
MARTERRSIRSRGAPTQSIEFVARGPGFVEHSHWHHLNTKRGEFHMTTVTVSEDINAKASAVWAALSDFGGIEVGGPITSFETTGKGVGMVRTIGMGGGKVVERLDRHDPAQMVFTYSILNEDCPLPVSGYSATVKIVAKGEGCNVNWSGTFEPKGVPEADAMRVVEGIYRGGIGRARKTVGG